MAAASDREGAGRSGVASGRELDALIGPAMTAIDHAARLMQNAEQAALVLAAAETGLLARCRRPITPERLALEMERPVELVADACTCLEALGVLVREGDACRLSTDFAAALDPAAGDLLVTSMRLGRARTRLVASLLTADSDYWSTDPDVQREIAEGVAFPPDAELSLRILARAQDAVPEVRDSAAAGGRHLELGCGVAGGLLVKLQLYPRLTVVGVDLSEELISEARRRAELLGVADRAEFVVADARDYRPTAPVDSVQWSQFFFPTESRPGTVASAFSALASGGHIVAPLMADPRVLADDLQSDAGREAAMDQLVHRSWGVPTLGAHDLLGELAEAGFVGGREWGSPPMRGVIAFKP
jgi:hypothetical protein